jgi:PAS domain S-box-containing protein
MQEMIEAPSARCCRLLVENLRDVLYLIDLERRELVFISPSVEQLLGYSVEEIHAMDLGTLVARLGPAAQEDASRELGLGSARRLELELTRKDRVPIWVEVDRTTLADGDGRRSVLGVVREITRRRQTEERLRESEENLRSFFESLDDMAFVVGPDGKIASCNRTALRKLGYNREALVGRPLVELHPPAVRDEATATVAAMLRGERDSCPLPVMSRGGDTIPVET